MLQQLRARAAAPVRWRMRRQLRRFLDATSDCRGEQQRVLRRLLDLNADSRFSRQYGLDHVRTAAEFRRALPIADYEFFRQPIDDLMQGDSTALLGRRNRLLMFSISSGTTGKSKFIPITRRFVQDYRRGWQMWGIRAFDAHSSLHGSHIVQLTSDYDKLRSPAGIPCGNISGLVQHMQKRIVRSLYTLPESVLKIADSDAKYYTSLRLALADDQVGIIMTANPSTLVHLAQLAEAEQESLIRDIADGTLSQSLPADVQTALRPRLIKRPDRARQLEQIVAARGRLTPTEVWPQLRLLGIWTGGSAGAYRSAVQKLYGHTPIRDHGLSASEGRMTIPLEDGTAAGVLDFQTHYYEFVPESEIESESPTVLEAHELQEGSNYFVLLTTASGLYRYDIHDVVRCTGFVGTVPVLEFLHKGAHIANLTGEKLTESQVVEAVASASTACDAGLSYFTISPAWSDPPRYQLLLERDDVADQTIATQLAQRVDRELQKLNCEYADKRASTRLGSLEPVLLPPGTWQRLIAERQASPGGSLEQYKHPCLLPKIDYAAELLQSCGRERTGPPSADSPRQVGRGGSTHPASKQPAVRPHRV